MLSVVFWSAPFCQRKITQARLNDAQYLRKMRRLKLYVKTNAYDV